MLPGSTLGGWGVQPRPSLEAGLALPSGTALLLRTSPPGLMKQMLGIFLPLTRLAKES